MPRARCSSSSTRKRWWRSPRRKPERGARAGHRLKPPWSLLEFFPEPFRIDILDVGAALNETPPYQSLVDAGRARIMGFEPDAHECETLNREYGEPHRFFPCFAGDSRPATFHETNWVLT